MKIIFNKKEELIDQNTTVYQLLDLKGYTKKTAVWVNDRQLLISEYPGTILFEDDIVKVMRIVGGG